MVFFSLDADILRTKNELRLDVGNAVEFSDTLLSEFILGFYGYGNYSGRYWFVGMEEGGGSTLPEIELRVRLWAQRGQRELEDVADYHRALGMNQFFVQPTQAQPTWNKLIRVVLAMQQPSPTLDMVKTYQREMFGSPGGDTCLLELLPLPSPSIGKWIYSDFATVEGLQSRETYRNRYAELRARHLKQKILEHRPLAVVFYGVDSWYQQWWRMIANTDFETSEIDGAVCYSAFVQSTKFFVIKHPASRGITNDYYHQIGRLLTS